MIGFPSNLLCPRCEDRFLESLTTPVGVVMRCPSCTGFFLEQAVLVACSQDRVQCHEALEEAKKLLLPTGRACPKCGEKMHDGRIGSPGTVVTLCASCRTFWVDASQLAQFDENIARTLQAHLEQTTPGQIKQEDVLPTAVGPSPQLGEAKGMAGLLKNLARSLDRWADRLTPSSSRPSYAPPPPVVPPSGGPIKGQDSARTSPVPTAPKPVAPKPVPAPVEPPVETKQPVPPETPEPIPTSPTFVEGPPLSEESVETLFPFLQEAAGTPSQEVPSFTPEPVETAPAESPMPVPEARVAPEVEAPPEVIRPSPPPEPSVEEVDRLRGMLLGEFPPEVSEPAEPAPAVEPKPVAKPKKKKLTDAERVATAAAVQKAISLPQPKPLPSRGILFLRWLRSLFKSKAVSRPPAPEVPAKEVPVAVPVKTPTPELSVKVVPATAPIPAPAMTPVTEPERTTEPVKVPSGGVLRKIGAAFKRAWNPAAASPAPKPVLSVIPVASKTEAISGPPPKKKVPIMDRLAAWSPRLLPALGLLLGGHGGYEYDFGAACLWGVVGGAVGMIVRLVRMYPFKKFQETTLQSVQADPTASAWRGIPVLLQGRLVPAEGYSGAGSLELAEGGSRIALDRFRSWEVLARLFGVKNLASLGTDPVTLRGWYRGSQVPFIEISQVRTDKTFKTSLIRGVRWTAAVVLLLLSILILVGAGASD